MSALLDLVARLTCWWLGHRRLNERYCVRCLRPIRRFADRWWTY